MAGKVPLQAFKCKGWIAPLGGGSHQRGPSGAERSLRSDCVVVSPPRDIVRQFALGVISGREECALPDWFCTSCGAGWSAGAYSDGCDECGGGAMERDCFVCGGKCGSKFVRAPLDSQDSQSTLESSFWK